MKKFLIVLTLVIVTALGVSIAATPMVGGCETGSWEDPCQ